MVVTHKNNAFLPRQRHGPHHLAWQRQEDVEMSKKITMEISWTLRCLVDIIIELDDGKIYRKALCLMVKTMVSCRFSLKPIR